MSFETYIAKQNWPAELTTIINGGLALDRNIKAGEARETARRAAEVAAALDAERDALYEFLSAELPEELIEALPGLLPTIKEQIAAMSALNLHEYSLYFTYTGPGLAPIDIQICRNNGSQPPYDRAILYVKAPRRLNGYEPDWQGDSWRAGTVGDALYRAALHAWRMAELQQEFRAEEAEREAHDTVQEVQAQAYEWQSDGLAAQQRADRMVQEIEVERMAAWVRSDPAVAQLVRAFIAIQEERSAMRERLKLAGETADDAWAHYETRRTELEQRIAQERRYAEDCASRARDALDEADRLRRELRETGR